MNCPVCLHTESEVVRNLTRLEVQQSLYSCKNCQSFFTDNNKAFNKKMSAYYDQQQTKPEQITWAVYRRFLLRAKRQIQFINQHIDTLKYDVIDFGCGFGLPGELLKKNAKSYMGVEIDPVRVNYCRDKLGLNVYYSLDELLNKHKLDRVILYFSQIVGLLENLTEFIETVARNSNELVVYIDTVNTESAYKSRLLEENVGEGLIWHSPKGLQAMFKRIGFSTVHIESVQFDTNMTNFFTNIPIINRLYNASVGELSHINHIFGSHKFEQGLFLNILAKK